MEIVTILDYENVDPNDIRDAIIFEFRKTREKIEELIIHRTNGDEAKTSKLYNAFFTLCTKDYTDKSRTDDNEFRWIEYCLSAAHLSCSLCLEDLRDRDFTEAIASFANANYFMGIAEGCDKAEELSELKKKFFILTEQTTAMLKPDQ